MLVQQSFRTEDFQTSKVRISIDIFNIFNKVIIHVIHNYRTPPFPACDRLGRPHSVPYFLDRNLTLMYFFRKARTVPQCVLYEKAINTDIYAGRFALITVFTFIHTYMKFSIILRDLYKNAQIFIPARFPLTLFLELICFKIIAERSAPLK